MMAGEAVLILATGTLWSQTNSNQTLSYDQNATQHHDYGYRDDFYQANDISLDLFGTDALDKHTFDHPSGHRVRHDARRVAHFNPS
jgi:hypothetical protein